jgi:predicted aldo/keto reductase-like oxidoreductase
VRKAIEASLKKTGLDYFDFYQVWGLSTMDVLESALKKGGMVDGIQRAKDEGIIKQGLGFTFHGTPDVFKAAVDSGAFIAATVSYNLMNRKEEELIEYAADNGVGIFIMNPLAGGVLAMAGDNRLDFLKSNDCGTWYGTLRFLLANKNISSALLGVSMPDQIEKNIKALENSEGLDETYRQDLIENIDKIKFSESGNCTGCKYCEVCPNGFSPSKLMMAIRDYKLYGVKDGELKNWIYSKYVHDDAPEALLQKCVECGLCQENCPQKLEIVKEIRTVKKLFNL